MGPHIGLGIPSVIHDNLPVIELLLTTPIIIAGGADKKLSFAELGAKIAGKAKAAILIGQTAKTIAMAVRAVPYSNVPVEFASSMADAVDRARKIAAAPDVVLLSPACASYDMFDNFQHRGQEFCRLVRETSG